MRTMRFKAVSSAITAGLTLFFIACACWAESPFAATVVSYAPGTGAASGFTNPQVALGSPERFTGEGLIPGAVTPFQPAFRPNEIVSLGVGGSLVIAFDHDVTNDPRNPFGIDLLVFGNSFFTDAGSGAGIVGGFVSEGGRVSLSADGVAWTAVRAVEADGLFPTLGYLDSLPYATQPGSIPSDFLRPVDPTLSVATLSSLDYPSLVDAYGGSGGGAGIDIGAVGLQRIRFVRIEGPATTGFSPEIDALADVAPLPANPDLNGDGPVDALDIAILLSAWGATDSSADLDASGVIDAPDLAVLLSAWNAGGNG